MNKKSDYVQFTLSSSNPKYNGVTVNMPLEEFLSLMEATNLQEQLQAVRPDNKPHRIQEF